MFETVDLYCERLGPNFWAEPVNALTNVSFLVGAWFAMVRAKHLNVMSPSVWCLLVLMCMIGRGSASFHSFSNNLTRFLDVLPILLFQLVYVWLYCREIARIRKAFAATIVFVYLAAAILGRQFPHILNGSLIYAPAIIIMFGMGIYHAISHRNARFVVMGAALVFVVSLVCRTVDGAVCPYFLLGTHFLWHLFNGLVLYLLLRAFLANRSMGRGISHVGIVSVK